MTAPIVRRCGPYPSAHRVDIGNLNDDIMRALHRSWSFDPRTITVIAEDGRVHLTGTVRPIHERQVAAATAWSATGGTDVDNQLEGV